MLDAIGAEAAVLDGGIPQAWKGELVEGSQSIESTKIDPVSWPEEKFISFPKILPAIGDKTVVLDARSADRFAGRPNPIDARPGHIPGSTSRPWESNIGEDSYFLSAENLRAQLAELGLQEDTPFISSCGSGVTACHNLLAAKIAGYSESGLYTGSWSEWSQDPERPIALS